MSNTKQTAVEWLIKKLENRQNGVFDGLPHLSVDEIYAQAKVMEIEQKVEFAEEYEQYAYYAYNASSNNRLVSPITAKQYHKLKYEIDK